MTDERTGTPIAPTKECDVIMKGGITSGVIYPRALIGLGRTYRLRRLGGASAGAIGAVLGAAAELGRGRPGAGFDALAALPDELGEGRLARLFQPLPGTRPLLGLLLAATGHDAPGPGSTGVGRWVRTLAAALRGWPLAAPLGALPGLAGLVLAVVVGGWPGVLVAVLAVVVLLVGMLAVLALAVGRTLTRDVPRNGFGICTGMDDASDGPGFTNWLSTSINRLAGRREDDPLLYGHLWTGTDDAPATVAPDDRVVDLRMVTTCLSQGRPIEMPWGAGTFFYERGAWARLFPPEVMRALESAPVARPESEREAAEWAWEEQAARRQVRPLYRLPDPAYLPVVVSVRMSLSFPLLIAAIPLWSIDRRSARTRAAAQALRAGDTTADPEFVELWFTDGGFCSNFPVHLFDEALPTRPAFAINLGSFVPGREASSDEGHNIEYARSNAAGILPSLRPIPTTGLGALTGFFSAALGTSREWNDASQLTTPGMRDRVVRVLQTGSEGGLNLFMDSSTIQRLGNRGEAAADALVDMFNEPHYGGATGWDNHRWVRYRALLASLPSWLSSFEAGSAAMADIDPTDPPSFRLSVRGRSLAARLAEALGSAADAVAGGADGAVDDLTAAPRPRTTLRRVPEL